MGMFDSVLVECPKCGTEVEFQSKAGECSLERYRAERGVPPEIAVDILDDVEKCSGCGIGVRLVLSNPISSVPMFAVPSQDT